MATPRWSSCKDSGRSPRGESSPRGPRRRCSSPRSPWSGGSLPRAGSMTASPGAYATRGRPPRWERGPGRAGEGSPGDRRRRGGSSSRGVCRSGDRVSSPRSRRSRGREEGRPDGPGPRSLHPPSTTADSLSRPEEYLEFGNLWTLSLHQPPPPSTVGVLFKIIGID